MNPLNVDLRLAREQAKITLQQIADQTHIPLDSLRIWKRAAMTSFPGGMYNRAFLRAYCECLGLDCHAIPGKIRSRKRRRPRNRCLETTGPRPWTQRRSLSPVVIWSAMLLISIASLLYSRQVDRGRLRSVFFPLSRDGACQTGSEASTSRRAAKPVPESSRLAAPPDQRHLPTSIPAALPISEPKERSSRHSATRV